MSPANVQRSISGLRMKVEIHPGQVKSSSTQGAFFKSINDYSQKLDLHYCTHIFVCLYCTHSTLEANATKFCSPNAVMWNLGNDNKRNSKSIAAAQRRQFDIGSDNYKP